MGIPTTMLQFAILVGALSASQAFLFGHDGKWNNLRLTWGPNPFSSKYFVEQPRTAYDASLKGWQKISDCDVNAPWRGNRYIKAGDYSVILLFDVKGFIAGIQTSIPKNLKEGYPTSHLQPPFISDPNPLLEDRWTITAYFVDPSTICTTGRTLETFKEEGTGTDLYLQLSDKPEESKLMPKDESGMAGTKWTEGKCFITMGKHYWYGLNENMDCDKFFPVFLLYNGGKLNAFGFALGANLTSPRYEHPGQIGIKATMNNPPKCLLDRADHESTMHVYLTSHPTTNTC